jgi:hypothetical protein
LFCDEIEQSGTDLLLLMRGDAIEEGKSKGAVRDGFGYG